MNTTYAEAASQERNKLSAIEELKTRRQWVVFCLEPDKTDATRLTKVPYNANNGYKASTTKTKNWATYDQAVAAYRNAKNADGTPSAIEDRQEQLNALYAHFYAPKTQAKSDPPRHAPPISLSDHDIVEMATRAKNGASFARLFAGNTDEFQNDESRADWHLCVQLAFWTGKDTVSMDRIFRQSGLMREKWDEMHGATTYGEMTLRDAANFCTNIYNPRKRIEENINTLLEIIKRATQKRQSGDKRKASYQIAPWPVDLETVLKHLDMNNEQGDAELFAYCFEKQICYDVHEKAWYTWQGQYWKKNVSEHQIFHLVSGHLGAVYLRAAADLMPNHAELQREIAVLAAKGLAEGKKELEDLQDKYKQLDGQLSQLQARSKLVGTSKRVKGILDFVRGDERIYVSGDVWDNQPWLLACTNGVIELQTGELRDGQPEDYIRTICPTEWAGIDTACPNWERFLQEIFEDKKENRDSLIAFLKRFLEPVKDSSWNVC